MKYEKRGLYTFFDKKKLMAETEQGLPVQEFDPLTIPPKTHFSPLTYEEILQELNAAGAKNSPPLTQLSHFYKAISSFNDLIERDLWNIQNVSVLNKANTIRTLPILAGREVECISAVQPAAWINDKPGGMYDPVNDQICNNCVGHWRGIANSHKQYLRKSVTTPYFIAIHIITVIAFIVSFMVAFLNTSIASDSSYKVQTIVIIGIIPIIYDIIAVSFIFIAETFWPEDEAPIEATKVQEQVTEAVSKDLQSLAAVIPQDMRDSLLNGAKAETSTVLAGQFIIYKFYIPAHALFTKLLFKLGSGPFHEKQVPKLEWEQFEEFLTVYRFLREISDTEIPDYEIPEYEVLGDNVKKNVQKAIVAGICVGKPEVHFQLLRLLALSMEKPEERHNRVLNDPQQINLYHYIGAAMSVAVGNDLRAKVSSSRKDQTPLENKLRIEIVVKNQVDEELVSFRSHASRATSSPIEFA